VRHTQKGVCRAKSQSARDLCFFNYIYSIECNLTFASKVKIKGAESEGYWVIAGLNNLRGVWPPINSRDYGPVGKVCGSNSELRQFCGFMHMHENACGFIHAFSCFCVVNI